MSAFTTDCWVFWRDRQELGDLLAAAGGDCVDEVSPGLGQGQAHLPAVIDGRSGVEPASS